MLITATSPVCVSQTLSPAGKRQLVLAIERTAVTAAAATALWAAFVKRSPQPCEDSASSSERRADAATHDLNRLLAAGCLLLCFPMLTAAPARACGGAAWLAAPASALHITPVASIAL